MTGMRRVRFELTLVLHRYKRRQPPSSNPVLLGNEGIEAQLCMFPLTQEQDAGLSAA